MFSELHGQLQVGYGVAYSRGIVRCITDVVEAGRGSIGPEPSPPPMIWDSQPVVGAALHPNKYK